MVELYQGPCGLFPGSEPTPPNIKAVTHLISDSSPIIAFPTQLPWRAPSKLYVPLFFCRTSTDGVPSRARAPAAKAVVDHVVSGAVAVVDTSEQISWVRVSQLNKSGITNRGAILAQGLRNLHCAASRAAAASSAPRARYMTICAAH